MIGKIDGTRKRVRRREKLMFDFKEKRRYWTLKEEAIDPTQWRTRV